MIFPPVLTPIVTFDTKFLPDFFRILHIIVEKILRYK
jgi:hypothetical protein